MSQVTTYLTVTRDDEDIEVAVWGRVEHFGSANPHERGVSVVEVDSDIPLTEDEYIRATEKLEACI